MQPRRSLPLSSLAILLLAGCGTPGGSVEGVALRRIISAQVAGHPDLGPQDLYKLLHQAAMGSAHAIDDTAGVRQWMEQELTTMGDRPTDPLIDTLAPEGAVVRVNLRPWVAAGRSTDSLLAAFIRSAEAIPQDTVKLGRFLEVADSMAGEGSLPFDRGIWREMVAVRRKEGFPAVHHSAAYETAYHPAYRVVQGALVP
jgi:hypothetical protein